MKTNYVSKNTQLFEAIVGFFTKNVNLAHFIFPLLSFDGYCQLCYFYKMLILKKIVLFGKQIFTRLRNFDAFAV